MAEKTNQEKLKEAWDNAPEGTKARVFSAFGHTRQSIIDIVNNGRKDESLELSLLYAIKQASKDVLADTEKKNELVQAI